MGSNNTAFTGFTLMVLVGLGVSACSADDAFDADSVEEIAFDAPADVSSEAGGDAMSEQDTMSERASASDDAAIEQAPGVPLPTGQALATHAGVVVTTSDIRAAVADTLTAAQRNGATVFTADVNIGDERDDGSIDGSGFFVVKVPPADLEALIVDLGATVGRISGRTQDTSDVTDQLVDLDIRIGVERDVIERFQNLLGEATEFEDIVEIERVIGERTIALEQLLAGQRTLDNRVERSTLTIQLVYEAPIAEDVPVDEGTDGIVDAWRSGWDVFVGALFAIGFVLAVAAPFLLTAALVASGAWIATRRLRHAGRRGGRSTPSPTPESPTDDGRATDPAVESLSADEELAGPTRRG